VSPSPLSQQMRSRVQPVLDLHFGFPSTFTATPLLPSVLVIIPYLSSICSNPPSITFNLHFRLRLHLHPPLSILHSLLSLHSTSIRLPIPTLPKVHLREQHRRVHEAEWMQILVRFCRPLTYNMSFRTFSSRPIYLSLVKSCSLYLPRPRCSTLSPTLLISSVRTLLQKITMPSMPHVVPSIARADCKRRMVLWTKGNYSTLSARWIETVRRFATGSYF
jgi:hypothetical protein